MDPKGPVYKLINMQFSFSIVKLRMNIQLYFLSHCVSHWYICQMI